MPYKCGKDGESTAKTPSSSVTKRVRRDETTTTHDASVTTSTAITEFAPQTDHGGSPHESNAEDDPALMVEYNESTPLPSSMDGEDSERMRRGDVPLDPITDAQTASVKKV